MGPQRHPPPPIRSMQSFVERQEQKHSGIAEFEWAGDIREEKR